MTYQPHPIDTSQVTVPREVAELAEKLAKNVHDHWSQARYDDGWSLGPCRDDVRKEHPSLVRYEDLPESEKQLDRSTALETVKAILAMGYKIGKDPSPNPNRMLTTPLQRARWRRFWKWYDIRQSALILSVAILTFVTNAIAKWLVANSAYVFPNYIDAIVNGGRALTFGQDDQLHGIFATLGDLSSAVLALLVGLTTIRFVTRATKDLAELRGMRGHDVIVGLGAFGRLLSRSIEAGRCVAIEENRENRNVEIVRQRDVLPVIGDAQDRQTLERAGITRANRAFVVAGSDEQNISITLTVRDLLLGAGFPNGVPGSFRCYTHVSNLELAEALKQQLRRTPTIPFDTFSVFNVFEPATCRLLTEQLLHERPRRGEVALYVIVGFGKMGQAVAQAIAELAHFENAKRSRVLILAENCQAAADEFLADFGRFSPKIVEPDRSTIHFDAEADEWGSRKQAMARIYESGLPSYDTEIGAIEYVCNARFTRMPDSMRDEEWLHELHRLTSEECVKPAVIFCKESDDANFAAAVALAQRYEVTYGSPPPIFCWQLAHESAAELLRAHSSRIEVFGSHVDILTPSAIAQPHIDKLAKAVHACWLEVRRNQPDSSEAELKCWEETDEVYRRSCRFAAYHHAMKVAALPLPEASLLRMRIERARGDGSGNVLAKMEHYRYVAERLMQGWRWQKARKGCERPQLCTWEGLERLEGESEKFRGERAKDVNQVFDVLDAVERADSNAT
jgi:voltage-gated potassium channel Kch